MNSKVVISRVEGKVANYIVDYPLTTVGETLRSLETGQVAIIDGPDLGEELRAYCREVKASYSRHLIGKEAIRLELLAARLSSLPAKSIRRIGTFLDRPMPYTFPSDLKLKYPVLDAIPSCSQEKLFDIIVKRYVSTRRVTDGAAEEMSAFLNGLKSYSPQGNGVFLVDTQIISIRDVIAIHMWRSARKKFSATILMDSYTVHEGDSFVSRTYIPETEMFSAAASHFKISPDTVKAIFSIWRKTQSRGERNILTLRRAGQFLGALEQSGAADGEHDVISVPAQRPAPLRVRDRGGRIDLQDAKQHHGNDAKVLGAAVACKNAATDLRDYDGFSNVIPSFKTKIQRIIDTIAAIIEDQYEDDSLIVQLGVEVDALDQRIFSCADQLGEFSLRESASCISVLRGFLAQFNIWNDYKALASPIEFETIGEFDSARLVISKIVERNDATTERARLVINKYGRSLSEDNDVTVAQRQGAITSAENVLTAAAGAFVNGAKQQGLELSAETAQQIKKKSGSAIAGWFVDNIGLAGQFATQHGLQWLKHLIDGLS